MGLRDPADDRICGKRKLAARHDRIGNIAMVAFLRKEIARVFRDRESLLAKKVVYNGSHAGGHLRFPEISPRWPGDRRIGMRNLIVAANREGHSMVF